MKNLVKLFGIIAIVAIVGFSMAGCGGGGSGSSTSSTSSSKGNSKGSSKGGGGFSGDGRSSSGGTFTLTGIPSKYNAQYALSTYDIDEDDDPIAGFQSYNSSSEKLTNMTFPIVSNGSVRIPQWKMDENNVSFARYSGNVASNITVFIHNIQTMNEDNANEIKKNTEVTVLFDSVNFSKGSASRSWSEADMINPPE
jgi:hypothetical protein